MDDAWVRINRAKARLETLEEEIAAPPADGIYPYGVDSEADLHGNVALKARITGPPPKEWGLAVGDILVDLRAALDYAVYSLAVSNTGESPPPNPKRIEFPVAKDPDWFRDRGASKIEHLPKAARDYIRCIQSYQRGHSGETDALWVLNELVGINKHRFIHILWHALQDTILEFEVDNANIENVVGYKVDGPLKHGTVLTTFRLVATKRHAKVQVKPRLTLHVAMEPGPPAFGNEVTSTLGTLGGAVENVVTELGRFVKS